MVCLTPVEGVGLAGCGPVLWFIMLMWTVLAGTLGSVSFTREDPRAPVWWFLGAAAGTAILVVSAGVFAIGVNRRRLLAPPTVSVSSARPRVGEVFYVAYEQRARRRIRLRRVALQLVFRESAASEEESAQAETVVAELEQRDSVAERGGTLHLEATFLILEDGMHTFAPDDGLSFRWFIKLRVEPAGWPGLLGERKTYEVVVPPGERRVMAMADQHAEVALKVILVGGERVGDLLRFDPGGELQGVVQVVVGPGQRCRRARARLQWRGSLGRVRVEAERGFHWAELPEGVSSFPFQFALPREPWSHAGERVGLIWEVEAAIKVYEPQRTVWRWTPWTGGISDGPRPSC